MSNHHCNKPIATNQSCIWIIISKHFIWESCNINITVNFFPILCLFCSSNMSFSHLFTNKNNRIPHRTSIFWIYPFSINSRSNNNSVPSNCHISSRLNCLKRIFFRPISIFCNRIINKIFHKNLKFIKCFLLNCRILKFKKYNKSLFLMLKIQFAP